MTSTIDAVVGSEATRVVLVDAHPERRAIMRNVFDHSNVRAAVVGEADGQAEALALVDEHNAELVIIDFTTLVEDGMETVAALRGRFPDLRIVVCSFNGGAATRNEALERGADAYLVKPVSAREVFAAVPGLARHAGSLQSTAAAH